MKFDNKTILITGASAGIGKALGEKLIETSCKLILVSRKTKKIVTWVNEIKNPKAKILILYNDVADKNSVNDVYQKSISEFGNIDVAILNSGVAEKITPQNFNSDVAEKIINTNFLGAVYWIEQILPTMLKRGKGIIAPVSSLADNRGYSGSGFYSASKAALSVFAEGLTLELKKHGIKVLTIKPGFVKTSMTDKNKFRMPFIISPQLAAEYILSGIEKEKRIIQFPFAAVVGSKIMRVLPYRIIEKLLIKK